MSEILRILKLKKELKINLDLGKNDVINILKRDLKPNQIFFFDIFDKDQKRYYGKIKEEVFELRLAQTIFPQSPFAKAFGKISGNNDETDLSIKIIGWNWFILLYLIVINLILSLALNDILTKNSYAILIVLVLMYLFFTLVALFKMRKGLKKFEKNLVASLKNFSQAS